VTDPWRRIARLPRGAVFLLALVLVLAGLFVPGPVGGVLLLALAVGLALLLRHTWPVTPARLRPIRLVVLALLFLAALVKIFANAW
jgi:hypothetical protein